MRKLKYRVGDIVEIEGCIHGHNFNIGEKVEIKQIYTYGNPHYRAVSINEVENAWFIEDDEIKHEEEGLN